MVQLLFGVVIFTSAFLLFYVEPLLAKQLLPTFGGSAGVWMASMLFFQIGLLIGYLYAFVLATFFSVRKQAFIHLVLLVSSFYFLPPYLPTLEISTTLWEPLAVLKILATHFLLPFVILSASSPLLQDWYCRLQQTSFPYIFYSISNIGSLLGLIGYPLVLETFLGISHQANLWTVLYIIYATLTGLCLLKLFYKKTVLLSASSHSAKVISPPYSRIFSWIGLSFLGSALLLAVTQFLTQNVVNLPLIWILPLALYLCSFIITFSKASGYQREFWMGCFLIWLMIIAYCIFNLKLNGHFYALGFLMLLYSGCMMCHGELIRLKPADQRALTLFYLSIALGGMLGGIFINIVAPLLFVNWWGFYCPLIILTVIALKFFYQQYQGSQKKLDLSLLVLGSAISVMLLCAIIKDVVAPKMQLVTQKRNLYGVLRVYDYEFAKPALNFRTLMHGAVLHGWQYQSSERSMWPTTYYTEQSGVGIAIQFLRATRSTPLKIGVVGLGAGVLATFTQPGDEITFYEIDKDVADIAQHYFSFLKRSSAVPKIILGDARIQLQHQLKHSPPSQYDLLVIDAFNGDVIPFHLITQEAMKIYQSHLKQGGIIAFHTTNTYLNLVPITKALAEEFGYTYAWVEQGRAKDKVHQFNNTYALLTHDPRLPVWLVQHKVNFTTAAKVKSILWTDDNNSILPLLKLSK